MVQRVKEHVIFFCGKPWEMGRNSVELYSKEIDWSPHKFLHFFRAHFGERDRRSR